MRKGNKRTIWKYEIDLEAFAFTGREFTLISIPQGAKYLTTASKRNDIILWFEVDPDAQKEQRVFFVVGTGQAIPKDTTYVGTAFMGAYVWHVYEATNAR